MDAHLVILWLEWSLMFRHNSTLYTCMVLAAESSFHHMCVSLNRPLTLMFCVLRNVLKCLTLSKALCLVMQSSLVFKSRVCSMNMLAVLKPGWMFTISWKILSWTPILTSEERQSISMGLSLNQANRWLPREHSYNAQTTPDWYLSMTTWIIWSLSAPSKKGRGYGS